MKELDPLGDFKKLLLQKKLEEIVAIPATLYFPAVIVVQLNEICEESGYTPGQLIIKALKGQIYHWDKFYQYVTTPPERPEDFIWPEDPLFCLACATTVHFIDSFTQSAYDPIAFALLNAGGRLDLLLRGQQRCGRRRRHDHRFERLAVMPREIIQRF
jgi:hypothetical protein